MDLLAAESRSLPAIFSLSFLVALTGAMAPGPLLTYTIVRAIGSHHGYLMGLWIVLGHAALELALIAGLLWGLALFLAQAAVVRAIGVAGGFVLILFGAGLLRDVAAGRIATDLAAVEEGGATAGRWGRANPVLGGAVISMANPYWWVWWASIGAAFMSQFGVSFDSWPTLAVFFLGHEAGDLAWYLVVSAGAFWGRQRLSRRAYHAVLVCCGLFMIGFGLYLGVVPFLAGPVTAAG
ncbi:MAG: LysE family transporter [Thermodesulfobacteriota bacterium]